MHRSEFFKEEGNRYNRKHQGGDFQAGNEWEVNKSVMEEMPPFEHIWIRPLGIRGGR